MGSMPTSMYGLNYNGGTTAMPFLRRPTNPVAGPATSTAGTGSSAPGGTTSSPSSTPGSSAPPSTPGYGAAPAPIAPGTTVSSPFGTQTYGQNGVSFTGSSSSPASTPSTSSPPSTPGGYNPAITYPGPYGNNADNYKVFVNNQNGGIIPAAVQGADPNAVSGSSPYMALATGNGPTGSFSLNPQNYATQQYAQNVANQTGGTITQATPYAPGSPFYTNQPQNLVTEGNGTIINPAVLAQIYGHGYSQSYANSLAQNYLNGTDAYNPGVQDTLGQNVWGYGTNTPVTASQNFQNGTIGNAQVLAQKPNTIPQGFLGPNQTVSNNPQTYNAPNPNFTPQVPAPNPQGNPAGNVPNANNFFSYLTSPQIQGLYGGNPFGNAVGQMGSGNLTGLMSLLSNSNSGGGNNLYNIAALLNLFGAGSQGSGNLNPLFFNNQSQASPQLYYPQFY